MRTIGHVAKSDHNFPLLISIGIEFIVLLVKEKLTPHTIISDVIKVYIVQYIV